MMDMAKKQEIHDKLINITDTAQVTVDEYIAVYGNDSSEKRGKEVLCRADVHARMYGLSVEKEGDIYTFTP